MDIRKMWEAILLIDKYNKDKCNCKPCQYEMQMYIDRIKNELKWTDFRKNQIEEQK